MMSNQRLEEFGDQLDPSSLVDDIAYSAVLYGEMAKVERPGFNVGKYRACLEEYLDLIERASPNQLPELRNNGYSGVYERFFERLLKKDRPSDEVLDLFRQFMRMSVLETRIADSAEDIGVCRRCACEIDGIRRYVHDRYHETEIYRGFDPFNLPIG